MRSPASTRFDAGACVDLGAFDPSQQDCGVGAWMARAAHVPTWITLMEDRQPDFFHGYQGFEPDVEVPLNRHGPRTDRWTMGDLKRLVDAFHAHGVSVLFGYWIHECRFVDDLHPELLIRDATGRLWQDRKEMNADFSPMRRMHADAENDVREGERYAAWSARRYAKLAEDFGFDGLFLGDGAMGFRRHGKDWKDLRHFDYHEDWLAEFRADAAFHAHDGCALHDEAASTPAKAADVHAHHWAHWVAWNTDRWTGYYRDMAEAVHATGGMLAAYNCMNYDPALARLHGVDYRGIAEAGLDILVFQAYDYAWGPLGPFGDLAIAKKDLDTNLATLLRTRAQVGYDTSMRIVITVETEDEVETWNAPVSHTLGETYAYGAGAVYDGERWRRAADGGFVVWGNSVDADEWAQLGSAFARLDPAEVPAPGGAVVWDERETTRLADHGVPSATEPELLYAHLSIARTIGDGPTQSALVKERWASVAPLAPSPRQAARDERRVPVSSADGAPRARATAPGRRTP